MTDKIMIVTEDGFLIHIELGDNADLMYLLSSLKAGSIVKLAIGTPTLICKIEIFEDEKEVFE